jgi:transcriptional regulator
VAYGTFIVPTDKAPTAVHVPFLIDQSPTAKIGVELHVARANPIHEIITHEGCYALLICTGPDAYISPDWYGVPNQVPTWVYSAVHLKGMARVLDSRENGPHVDRLSAFFEARVHGKQPWSADMMEDQQKRSAMVKAIVTISLEVDTIEAQKKMIQHKGATEHHGAIAGLRATGEPGAAEVAKIMEETALSKFGK